MTVSTSADHLCLRTSHSGSPFGSISCAGRGSHANYPHPGTHGRFLGMADDHNDRAGVTWNARARIVEPWPPRLMRFGGRLSKHVVNVWQQVCAGLDLVP